METAEKILRDIASVLPYDMQAGLLALRDDGDKARTLDQMPNIAYFGLLELGYINKNADLTELGLRISNYCIC